MYMYIHSELCGHDQCQCAVSIKCVMIHMSVITQSGQSALMKGAYYGHTDIVKELVTAGANLNLQDNVCQ